MRNGYRYALLTIAFGTGAAMLVAQDRRQPDRAQGQAAVTDAEFVAKAASGGMFEVESSKIAKDAARSAEVKQFAEKMIADHEKANKELKDVAKKANVEVPAKMTDEHQKMLDRVTAARNGAAFDATYVRTQIAAHEEAVALFMNAAKNLRNADLKAFAEKTLPTLKEHHEHVKKHGAPGRDR